MLPKPLIQDSYDPVTDKDFEQFESKHGFKLPRSYKDFLRKHNGGSFNDIVISAKSEKDHIGVNLFYALNAPFDYADLSEVCKSYKDELPSEFFPISDDGMGNPICMNHQTGNLVCFDHEAGELSNVASDLEEFLAGIRYYDDHEWYETEQPFLAAEQGDVEYLDQLTPVETEKRNQDGRTALAVASVCAQPLAVRTLLENSANVNAMDNEGQTPLILAASHGAYDVCRLLIDSNADLDAQDSESRTALIAAMTRHDDRVSVLLIESGAAVDIADEYGNSPASLCQDNDLQQYVGPLLRERGVF